MAGQKKTTLKQDEKVAKRSICNQALHALANDPETSIKKQAERLGVTRGQLYGWLLTYEGEKYRHVIDNLPHMIAGETIEIADGECMLPKRDDEGNIVLDEKTGEPVLVAMPPARAKNAINSRQFLLERRFPKKYGRTDRVDVSVEHRIVGRLHAARARMSEEGIIEAKEAPDQS